VTLTLSKSAAGFVVDEQLDPQRAHHLIVL
jgi:hypothetical protein